MTGLALQAKGLSLTLGKTTILDGIDVAAAPGRLLALAGPSGSGKSSLLYLLSGLLTPDAGTIAWADTDIARLSEGRRDAWRRANAGFIFQDFHLIEELSPLDNVLSTVWLSRFSAAEARPRAIALLDRLAVPAKRNAALLSRGEKQRVAIARALVLDPAVIFADEPTASLDADAARATIDLLAAMARDEGRTVVAASHDPELLQAADDQLRLLHGRRERALA